MSKRYLAAVVLGALSVVAGTTACSRPDPNPPVRVTGDPDAANPPTSEIVTTTVETTTTTLFYSNN